MIINDIVILLADEMMDKKLTSLPILQIPDVAHVDSEDWRLSIDGLVENPLKLSIRDITNLPNVMVYDDFTCLEGWTMKGLSWKGAKVSQLLMLVSIKSTAKYVVFSSGDYTQGLSIQRCMEPTTILAYELNEAPLMPEHGAPLRLISRGPARLQ